MKARGWLLLVAAGVGACDSIDNHLLEGQEYSAAGMCLTEPAAIDDLPGSDPGDNCAAACLEIPGEGGATTFITTTCPPYTGYPVTESADAARDAADPCVGAFAAYRDGAICTSLDATLPDAGKDAGPDGASTDAAGDTGSAASEAAAEASTEASTD